MYRIELNGREFTVNGEELARIRERGGRVTFILA